MVTFEVMFCLSWMRRPLCPHITCITETEQLVLEWEKVTQFTCASNVVLKRLNTLTHVETEDGSFPLTTCAQCTQFLSSGLTQVALLFECSSREELLTGMKTCGVGVVFCQDRI